MSADSANWDTATPQNCNLPISISKKEKLRKEKTEMIRNANLVHSTPPFYTEDHESRGEPSAHLMWQGWLKLVRVHKCVVRVAISSLNAQRCVCNIVLSEFHFSSC